MGYGCNGRQARLIRSVMCKEYDLFHENKILKTEKIPKNRVQNLSTYSGSLLPLPQTHDGHTGAKLPSNMQELNLPRERPLLRQVQVARHPQIHHLCQQLMVPLDTVVVEAEVLDGDLLRSEAGAKAAVDGVPVDGAKADLRGSWRWNCAGLTARPG